MIVAERDTVERGLTCVGGDDLYPLIGETVSTRDAAGLMPLQVTPRSPVA
jgi:hypothetical protein